MFTKSTLIVAVIAMTASMSKADIVINEIMKNPETPIRDVDGEWFELFNSGNTAVNLDGWTIRDDGSDSHVINNGGNLIIGAGEYLVLGNNDDFAVNGNLQFDYEYSDFALSNGGDEIVLLDLSATEVDRVNYNNAEFPNFDGESLSLISPFLDNNIGANWEDAKIDPSTFETLFDRQYFENNFGTPGAINFSSVPEPSSIAVLGFFAIGLLSRRRQVSC